MIAVNHDGDARARTFNSGPLSTRSTKIGDGLVFPPYLVDKYDYTGGDERRLRPVNTALGTVTTSPHGMLAVPPFIAEMYGTSTVRGVGHEALSTVTAGGGHHGLAVPPGAFLSRQYTQRSNDNGGHLNTHVSEPMRTITASGGNHALVVPQRKRPTERFDGDLPFSVDDVRFRMLGPTEHLRAQRFAENYDTSAANKSETTKGAGNAVAVNVAHWIGDEIKEVL